MAPEFYTHIPSPLGELTLASDGKHLTGLWLPEQRFFAGTLSPDAAQKDDLPVFELARRWLKAYFSGQKPDVSQIPLAPKGTLFRQRVWQRLREIPYGETVTYGQIARELGEPMSPQAVGGAVGRNPISIIIPCHRVVGTGGSLTGYASGLAAKQWLLKHEQNTDLSKE